MNIEIGTLLSIVGMLSGLITVVTALWIRFESRMTRLETLVQLIYDGCPACPTKKG